MHIDIAHSIPKLASFTTLPQCRRISSIRLPSFWWHLPATLLLSVHTEHFELPFCGYVDLLFFIVVTFYDLPRATLTDCRRGRSADISRNLRVFLIALVARLYLHPAAKRTKFYQNISNISLLLGSLLHKLILQRDAEVLHTEWIFFWVFSSWKMNAFYPENTRAHIHSFGFWIKK